jgi:hypothetical protein
MSGIYQIEGKWNERLPDLPSSGAFLLPETNRVRAAAHLNRGCCRCFLFCRGRMECMDGCMLGTIGEEKDRQDWSFGPTYSTCTYHLEPARKVRSGQVRTPMPAWSSQSPMKSSIPIPTATSPKRRLHSPLPSPPPPPPPKHLLYSATTTTTLGKPQQKATPHATHLLPEPAEEAAPSFPWPAPSGRPRKFEDGTDLRSAAPVATPIPLFFFSSPLPPWPHGRMFGNPCDAVHALRSSVSCEVSFRLRKGRRGFCGGERC